MSQNTDEISDNKISITEHILREGIEQYRKNPSPELQLQIWQMTLGTVRDSLPLHEHYETRESVERVHEKLKLLHKIVSLALETCEASGE